MARLPDKADLPSIRASAAKLSCAASFPSTSKNLTSGLVGWAITVRVGTVTGGRLASQLGRSVALANTMAWRSGGASAWLTGKRAPRQLAFAPNHEATLPAVVRVALDGVRAKTKGQHEAVKVAPVKKRFGQKAKVVAEDEGLGGQL